MGTRSEDLLILYEEYLARSGQSLFTIRSYLSDLKLFYKWYQETYEVKQVDHTVVKDIDLLSYRNYLQYEKRHRTATTNQHVAALRSFFSFLHSKGFIRESVVANLKPLSKPYLRAPDVPKRAQILKLFRMVDTSSDRGKRDFAVLQLFVPRMRRLRDAPPRSQNPGLRYPVPMQSHGPPIVAPHGARAHYSQKAKLPLPK